MAHDIPVSEFRCRICGLYPFEAVDVPCDPNRRRFFCRAN